MKAVTWCTITAVKLLCSPRQQCYEKSGDHLACTNLAYNKAISDGVDVLDCPVQMSKDGTPFFLNSIDLIESTTVAQSSFSKFSMTIPEIKSSSGIFAFNLTWNDINNLTRVQRRTRWCVFQGRKMRGVATNVYSRKTSEKPKMEKPPTPIYSKIGGGACRPTRPGELVAYSRSNLLAQVSWLLPS
ncbi:Protein SUPPRESSOR OF NPR1-1 CONSTITUTIVE 4 [Glycine soja]|uniref:glycerophosphodiester phosphodiesterase n=1 Tax=Glycine soja TaxID=3848 RepID=A0A445FTW1_GLYSO|nr:Protein SUPPRESSOR OF NPR1-1 CONSTITUTIVE 4 [Glycine soja]